jgi:hypothetical protein
MRMWCSSPRSQRCRWCHGTHLHTQHLRCSESPCLQANLDETCCFLATDFDKATWHQDATPFLEACGRLQLPAAVERSRSGRGGHVWIFFEDALPAALARRLGSHLLTEAMEERPDIGFDS